MDQLIVNELYKEYESNCNKINELALNNIVNIEIPYVNTLATLPRHVFLQLLFRLHDKIKHMPLHEQSFIFTLLNDVLVSAIRYDSFFDTYAGDNTRIIELLWKKVLQVVLLLHTKEEALIIQKDLNLMEKSAEKIIGNNSNCNTYLRKSKLVLNEIIDKNNYDHKSTLWRLDSNQNIENKENFHQAKKPKIVQKEIDLSKWTEDMIELREINKKIIDEQKVINKTIENLNESKNKLVENNKSINDLKANNEKIDNLKECDKKMDQMKEMNKKVDELKDCNNKINQLKENNKHSKIKSTKITDFFKAKTNTCVN